MRALEEPLNTLPSLMTVVPRPVAERIANILLGLGAALLENYEALLDEQGKVGVGLRLIGDFHRPIVSIAVNHPAVSRHR